MEVQEGSGLLEQHGGVEVRRSAGKGRRPARRGNLLGGGLQGSDGGGGNRPLVIGAGKSGFVGLGGVGSLLFSLGETGKGHIVGFLSFLGDGAGLLPGRAPQRSHLAGER